MVDFKKKLASKSVGEKIDPIEIYDSLDRSSDKGPLRPAQEEILKDWFNNHNDKKDVIIKLHTGQGKTLIGLLILQSKLNQKKGPAMFICPNIHLADQTCEQAKQFGIKYCRTEDANGNLPNDFLESKSILITYVQKVFNGLSKFGIGLRSIDTGAIVLDDSHACIDHIENAVCIKIPKEDQAYSKLIELFEEDLEMQGAAKLEEIKEGVYEAILPVPYWAWAGKYKSVIKLLLKSRDESYMKFSWPLLQDDFENCRCVVGSQMIEIIPYRVPIELFGSYNNCKSRIFMSATTTNDSFFIKGLNIDKKTILHPLTYSKEKWSGEKMILIPYEISPDLDRSLVVSSFAKSSKTRKFGIIGLTPSERATKLWEANGATVVNSGNIKECISDLKSGNYEKTLVFANRYDGIDLPDNMCRVLVLDSRPYAQSLFEQYQEKCRVESDLIDIKIAQKIEQGLGRGVRGEKDYCVIVIATYDIVNSFGNRRLKKYFSAQTNKQIEIGIGVTKSASEEAETDDSWKVLSDVINQALKRDEDWKKYYIDEMNSIVDQPLETLILDILELEKKAENEFYNNQNTEAKNTLQGLIDTYIAGDNKNERGWYLQEMSRMIDPINKTESNRLQIFAHKNNRTLLKPLSGMEITKLEMNGDRIQNIKEYLSTSIDFNELKIKISKILSDFTFGNQFDKFEYALYEIGRLLGFGSERPCNDWKAGPDNLWNIKRGEYILFECKNEVYDTREEINKSETGQMNNSCAWFKNNYAGESVKNVMIIPTLTVSAATGFNDNVVILRKWGLSKLKKNIISFINEFKGFDLLNLSTEQIYNSLKSNELLESNVLADYFEEPKQKKRV